jgi:hypothetical protein
MSGENQGQPRISGVQFSPVVRRMCRSGDNFCMTWADDGCLYTSCDDGWGWNYLTPAEDTACYNNRVWRLRGGREELLAEYLPSYPLYTVRDEWYGFGLICVEGVLYHFITCASDNSFSYPFQGAKLLYSRDHGEHWYLHDGGPACERERSHKREDLFFWHEGEEYLFSNIEFLQCGQNDTLNQDGYVYLYSPGGRYHPHHLHLARVPRGQILERGAYEFYTGTAGGAPAWCSDIRLCAPIHTFPQNYGWYSWLPSVVYNHALECYIMASGGTGVDGSGMHEKPAFLGIYAAAAPWGPWTPLFETDHWVGDNEENRLYQPKLCPKWISPDGREMTLVYSDACDNWGRNYRWNQQQIYLPK